jgi:hypothetical protein
VNRPGGLDRHEWDFEDFDGVPEPECRACCWWEYARESDFIRREIVRYDERLKAGERVDTVLSRYPVLLGFLSELGHTSLKAAAVSHGDAKFPKPWQSLNEAEQRALTKSLALWTSQTPPQHAVSFAPWWFAGKLAKELAVPTNRSRPSLRIDDREIVLLTVDWTLTPRELGDAFYMWAKRNGPEDLTPPDGRGHKPIDWLKKLRDLGVMRLLYESEVRNMKIYQPEAWQRYGCRGERFWYSAHERALNNFRSLLWFLPDGELPRRAPTKPERNRAS